MDVKWYHIVGLICVYLMTNDVDHLFIVLLYIPFAEISIQILCSFQIELFVFIHIL